MLASTFTVPYDLPVAVPTDRLFDCRAVREPVAWVTRERYHGAVVCVSVIWVSVLYIQQRGAAAGWNGIKGVTLH